eukprot:6390059-Prymnesium_polylepis.1
MFDKFGPELFVDANGESYAGRLSFEDDRVGQRKAARWIKLSNVVDREFLQNVEQLMVHCWKLPRPELVLSFAGSVADFDISPQLSLILGRGLAAATRTGK